MIFWVDWVDLLVSWEYKFVDIYGVGVIMSCLCLVVNDFWDVVVVV